METSTLTQSVIPANESNLTTSHCLSNDAVAGIVVGAAVGLAIITALVIFFCMRRKRHPRSRRRHHRSLDGPQVPRKTRDRPAVVEIPNTSSVLENYLPQSADDSTVERRARTTLEQIGFHVDNFYQSQSVVASSKSDDGLTGFDSPYLPAPLMTLLSQSKDTIPLIVHALAYFVILSLSPFKHSKHSLLPIEFVTLPSSVGFLEASGSTKAELLEVLSKWRVLTAYLHSNAPDNVSYRAQVDEHIQNMATSFSTCFAPWKNGRYRSKDRVRNLSEILKQAADLGVWMFSQPSAFRFDWSTGTPQSSGTIAVLPGLLKETNERGIRLKEAQVMVKPIMKWP